MALTKAQKTQIIKDFQLYEGDTGSPEVQIALLGFHSRADRSLERPQEG